MKKFAVTYIIMMFVLAIAWPVLGGGDLSFDLPGDTAVMIDDIKIHLLYGTSLIISLFIILILWILRKL